MIMRKTTVTRTSIELFFVVLLYKDMTHERDNWFSSVLSLISIEKNSFRSHEIMSDKKERRNELVSASFLSFSHCYNLSYKE